MNSSTKTTSNFFSIARFIPIPLVGTLETNVYLFFSKCAISIIFVTFSLQNIENPRNELVENSLEVSNNNFLDLGLKPIYLNQENIIDIYNFIRKNKNIIDNTKILPMSFW